MTQANIKKSIEWLPDDKLAVVYRIMLATKQSKEFNISFDEAKTRIVMLWRGMSRTALLNGIAKLHKAVPEILEDLLSA